MAGTMTSISDFPDGKGGTDWKAYKDAQCKNGETCSRCGEFITAFGPGYARECSGCKDLDSDKLEVEHDKYLRCPYCKHSEDVYEGEHYSVLNDGEHDVTCSECGREFTVRTDVSYSFTSGPIED